MERRGAEFGRVTRRDLPTVPPVALREALVNAVVHTDYSQRGAPIRIAVFSDRVEVENPGIPLPGLTTEELHEGVSRLCNRVIARTFKELRLIERWGSGNTADDDGLHQRRADFAGLRTKRSAP